MKPTRRDHLQSLLAMATAPLGALLQPCLVSGAVAAEANRPAIGVHTGYGMDAATSTARVQAFERVIGRQVDFIAEYGSGKDWADARSSPAHSLRTWRQVSAGSPRRLFWSQPLTAVGTPLADVAAGEHDSAFLDIATKLRTNGFYDAVIRLGWDMNASWVPWATTAQTAADYIAAFRRVVAVFRTVSPSFRFCWNPARDEQIVQPEKVYPGDDVVDFIGLSVVIRSIPADGSVGDFFARVVVGHGLESKADMQPYSLAWLSEFAHSHGKGMIICDYGIGIDTSATRLTSEQVRTQQRLIELVADWIVSNEVALHCWRDTPQTDWEPLNTRISLSSSVAGQVPADLADEKPELASAFREAWRIR